jgi:RNA polymerase sigma-70 factor, ECF subfamily
MTLSDFELKDAIRYARRLDLYALGQVYDHFYPVIYRYVVFRLGDNPASRQTCTAVFDLLLAALKKHPAETEDVQGWLLETACELVNKHPGAETIDDGESPGDGSLVSTSHAQNESAWLGDLVRRSLRGLPLEQQHLLALRFAVEVTIEEAASLMDKKAPDLKTLQMQALIDLRRLLEEGSQ